MAEKKETTEKPNEKVGTIESSTYFEVGTKDTGTMSIDLVTYRQKGKEVRYVAMNFGGMNIKEDPHVAQEAFYNFESEEEFNKRQVS